MCYTSGTTGHPKGVVHSHLSVTTAVLGDMAAFAYTEQDVVSGWLPLFHCAQHVLAATACAAGACLVLSRTFVPAEIAQLVLKEGITVFVGLPMMYAAVLADPAFRPASVRQCVYAMAPIPAPLIAQIAARMSDNILLATGQTEIYPATMSFRPLQHPGRDANYWGTSLVTCETAVMDDEGRLLGPGQVGEIVHRGPNVMLGYFKDPQATAEAQKFGWHHTGDLGMWDEGGQMLFLDRKKDMIKTGGENVASVKVGGRAPGRHPAWRARRCSACRTRTGARRCAPSWWPSPAPPRTRRRCWRTAASVWAVSRCPSWSGSSTRCRPRPPARCRSTCCAASSSSWRPRPGRRPARLHRPRPACAAGDRQSRSWRPQA